MKKIVIFTGFILLAAFSVIIFKSGKAFSSKKWVGRFQNSSLDAQCVYVQGPFLSKTLPPSDCESPVGICTEGRLYGSLKGRYRMVSEKMFPAEVADVPLVNYFSARSVIYTKYGELIDGIDTGSLNLDESDIVGSGVFSSMLTMTAGARGYLFISGRLFFEKGEIKGFYRGKICRPRHL